jgi:uncharacterized protein YgiB involved in biofilm formation
MKRSKKLTLTLMAAGSSIALGACGEKRQESEKYASLEECKAANVFSDEQCQTSYNSALTMHEKSSPRYNSRALCEQEFNINRCEQRTNSNGSSFWSPFLAGYLVSNIVDGSRSHYYSSPYYNTRYGRSYTWNGDLIDTRRTSDGRIRHSVDKKAVTAKPKPARVMTRTSVISRGGFGSRSSSRSSSGRSRGG